MKLFLLLLIGISTIININFMEPRFASALLRSGFSLGGKMMVGLK